MSKVRLESSELAVLFLCPAFIRLYLLPNFFEAPSYLATCAVNSVPWNPAKSGSWWWPGLPLATVGFKARIRTEGQHSAAVWWARSCLWSDGRWPPAQVEKYRFPLPVWRPWTLPLNGQACPSPAGEATDSFYPAERSDRDFINANAKDIWWACYVSSFFPLLCDCQEKRYDPGDNIISPRSSVHSQNHHILPLKSSGKLS